MDGCREQKSKGPRRGHPLSPTYEYLPPLPALFQFSPGTHPTSMRPLRAFVLPLLVIFPEPVRGDCSPCRYHVAAAVCPDIRPSGRGAPSCLCPRLELYIQELQWRLQKAKINGCEAASGFAVEKRRISVECVRWKPAAKAAPHRVATATTAVSAATTGAASAAATPASTAALVAIRPVPSPAETALAKASPVGSSAGAVERPQAAEGVATATAIAGVEEIRNPTGSSSSSSSGPVESGAIPNNDYRFFANGSWGDDSHQPGAPTDLNGSRPLANDSSEAATAGGRSSKPSPPQKVEIALGCSLGVLVAAVLAGLCVVGLRSRGRPHGCGLESDPGAIQSGSLVLKQAPSTRSRTKSLGGDAANANAGSKADSEVESGLPGTEISELPA